MTNVKQATQDSRDTLIQKQVAEGMEQAIQRTGYLQELRDARSLADVQDGHSFDNETLGRLESLLNDERFCYMDDESFHRSNARKVVFDRAPEIERPDTSWYHPVMDSIGKPAVNKSNKKPVLLTAKQERALFLQFNYCRYQVEKLRKRIGKKRPIKVELAEQIMEWFDKSEHYRDQIAQTNLALVLAMAKRTRMNDGDFGDMICEGNMALLRAIDKFDVSRGFKFSTYACRAILKAFSRAGMKFTKYRQVFPTDYDPKMERSNHDEIKRNEHKADCVDEVREIIRDNRASLTNIEQEVIEHRFAVGESKTQDDSPMTLEQVGRIIGVTKERVRQIQNKALVKIRESLETGFLS